MCSKCETLGALLLAEAFEADLLAADIEDGLAPAGAVRPLFDHERRAAVRFADLDTDTDTAVEEAEAVVAGLHLLVGGAVLDALFGKDRQPRTPAELMASLDQLVTSQPAAVHDAVQEAAEQLQEVFEDAYARSSAQVVQEAVRQGAGKVAAPRPAPAGAFQPNASAVAAHPWRRIVGKVQEELSKPAVLAADTIEPATVEKVLEGIKPDGSTDLARQSINTAAGMGRVETAEEMEPAEVWASEIMDGNTCTPCSHVDGKDYASMAEAREDYPVAGYRLCDGEARCRGTLVFVFEDA